MLTDIPMVAPISYLTLYNAHNGDSVKIPKPIRFHSLNGLKSFIHESFTDYIISDIENIFLLTSFGMKVKFNIINELNDIYVFDKRLFSGARDETIINAYVNQNEGGYKEMIKPTPSSLVKLEKTNIKQMTSSLKVNDGWSKALFQDCLGVVDQMKAYVKQINTIFKCLNIIFQFGSNFINGIEKSFNNYLNYIKLLNLKTLHRSWNGYYNNLRKFPSFQLKNGTGNIKISDHLNTSELEKSSSFVSKTLPLVINKFNEMSASINSVNDDKVNVDKLIESLRNESIENFKDYDTGSEDIIKDVSRLSQLISHDIDKLSTNVSISLDWVYRIHKDEISPKIFDKATGLYKILQNLYLFKNKIVDESLSIFGKIANLQMRMVNIKNDLRILTNADDNNNIANENEISIHVINNIKSAEDYLSLTIDLPLLFGFMLIEKRRQFEWHEFYSKGIVNNVSEQLSVIIDHEKIFRKLWLKKFGNFLSILNSKDENDALRTVLPSIDVTLVNGNAESNSTFGIINNIQVERDDISTYINALEEYSNAGTTSSPSSKKFSELMKKNFQDLIKCTNNMKRVTKMVSSLSSFTSPVANEIKNNDKLLANLKDENNDKHAEGGGHMSELGEVDYDINLVKGLKIRIRKLENLLHQQQYKDLSNWPVTRSNGANATSTSETDGKFSLILDLNQKTSTSSNSKIDPTNLLQRRQTLPLKLGHEKPTTSQQSNHLDVSTTIDKHLDNIRLKKENNELTNENLKLSNTNRTNEKLIEALNKQISNLKTVNDDQNKHHEEKLRKRDAENQQTITRLETELQAFKPQNNKEVVDLKDKLSLRDAEILDLRKDITRLHDVNEGFTEEVTKLNEKIATLQSDINDVNAMKKDLLSNMASKETDTINHRISLEEEIKKLHSKIEELTEDYENLMDLTQSKHNNLDIMVNYLNNMIIHLLSSIKCLVEQQFETFIEFCFILESMGLLLIKEHNNNKNLDEYKITRVKGLKSKRNDKIVPTSANGNVLDETPIVSTMGNMPTSKVVDDINKIIGWVDDIQSFKNISTKSSEDGDEKSCSANTAGSVSSSVIDDLPEEITNLSVEETNKFNRQSLELVKLFRDIFKSSNGSISKFEDFINTIRFKENICINQNQDDSGVSNKFFLGAITKRFKDVEGFAKKLTKENKSKAHELSQLIGKLNCKISMNSFEMDDLVLFLPTRIDRAEEIDENFQPWAAFNIGAPHYFLRVQKNEGNKTGITHSIKDKEWMVGRVTYIEEHTVTDANFNDKDANPFHLSTGVVWYVVDAKEEIF